MAHLNSQSIRQVAPTLLRVESLEERALLTVANLGDLANLVNSSSYNLTSPAALYSSATLTAQTTYYYRVSSVNRAGVSGSSDLVSITSLPAPDAYEPNNSISVLDLPDASANLGLLTSNTSITNLSCLGDDYFRFELNDAGSDTNAITLSLPTNSAELLFELLDSEGELVVSSENGVISLEDVEPGVYYLHIYPDEYDAVVANYALTFAVPYRAVVATAATNLVVETDSPYSISLTWQSVFGALDHEVQRSHDALTWTTPASELTSLELAEEDPEPNTTYYYRVGASFLNSEVRFWSSATLITTPMEDNGLLSNDTFEYIDAQLARYSNGGSLTNTYTSSLSKTKTLNRSVDLTSLANYLTGSRLAERYDELAEGRWHTDSYSIVNHEDRNSNLSYNKTVEIEDAEDYIQIPTGVTLTDFQEKYELTETDSYNYDVNCTLVYNAAHNCYELADGGTGSCTRNYSFVDDSYVMATGQSAGGGSSMSPSGTVTRKWGDKTSNKINYSCTLTKDNNNRPKWLITAVDQGKWNDLIIDGLSDRFNKKIVGKKVTSSYDDYSFSGSGLFASTYTTAIVKTYNSSEHGHFWLVKDNGISAPEIVAINHFSVAREKIDRDYTEKTPATALGEYIDTYGAKTYYQYGIHTDRPIGGYYDGRGQYRVIASESLKIGSAYRNETITQKTTQPYSRYYDTMNRGIVSGSQSGYASNDRSERSSIDATVYYNTARYRMYYAGKSTVNKDVERSYSGSGSYSGTSTDTRSSSYSESGSSKNSTETITIFDLGKSSSAISVTHNGEEIVDSTFNYTRHTSNTIGEVEHDTMTETSHSKRNWDYYSRQTSSGEVVSYGNTWNATGSGSTSSSFLDPWFDYVPVQTLYTEDYEFELNCKLTKSASSANPTVNQHTITTITRNREYKQVWQDPDDPHEEAIELDPINPNITLTSFSSKGNDVKYYIALRFNQIDSYQFDNYGTNSDSYNPKEPTSDLIRIPGDGKFHLQLSLPNFTAITQLSLDDAEVAIPQKGFIARTILPEESKKDIETLIDSLKEQVSFTDAILLLLNERIEFYKTCLTTAYNLSVKAANFVYDIYLRESVEIGMKTFDDMQGTNNNGAVSFVTGLGVGIANFAGIVKISNAIEGEDLASGRQLSATERATQGAIGAFELGTIAFSWMRGLRALPGGVRACSGVWALLKGTGCFVVGTPVITYDEYVTVQIKTVEESFPKSTLEDDGIHTSELSPIEHRLASEYETKTLNESVRAPGNSATDSFTKKINETSFLLTEDGAQWSNNRTNVSIKSSVFVLGVGITLFIAGIKQLEKKHTYLDAVFEDYDEFETEGATDFIPKCDFENLSSNMTLSNADLSNGTNANASANIVARSPKRHTAKEHNSKVKRQTNAKNWLNWTSILIGILCILYSTVELCLICNINTKQIESKRSVQPIMVCNDIQDNVSIVENDETYISDPENDSSNGSDSTDEYNINCLRDGSADWRDDVNLTRNDRATDNNGPNIVELEETTYQKNYVSRAVAIEDIKIGTRTAGRNPRESEYADESCFIERPHLIFSLTLPKYDGSNCNIKLLRSADWLANSLVRLVDKQTHEPLTDLDVILAGVDPIICRKDCVLEIWLELHEMGCVGWAELTEISDDFVYRPGLGNLVTGTFEHEVREAVNLYIEDQNEPLGVTETHPIWSVDRDEFVPVRELIEGERVLLHNGDTKRVVQKLPRPGPEKVHNLEVFGQHVYLVSEDGVLVHNSRACGYEVDIIAHQIPGIRKVNNCLIIVFEELPDTPIIIGAKSKVSSILRDNRLTKRYNTLMYEGHHVPSNLFNRLFSRLSYHDGISVSLPRKYHMQTSSFGKKKIDQGISAIKNLNQDLNDLGLILKSMGFYDSSITQILDAMYVLNILKGGIL